MKHTPYKIIFHSEKWECIYDSKDNHVACVEPNKANEIVHAVNMHEKIVEALKHAHNSLRTFRNVPKDDQEWTPIDDEAMKLIEETLSQAERK